MAKNSDKTTESKTDNKIQYDFDDICKRFMLNKTVVQAKRLEYFDQVYDDHVGSKAKGEKRDKGTLFRR